MPDIQDSDAFTIAQSAKGNFDLYDFRSRGALIRHEKQRLRLPEGTPLPAPWTLEIEPTDDCNTDCSYCSYTEARKKCREHKHTGLPPRRVSHVLEAVKTGGTRGIYVSGGGEATTWSGFEGMITQSAAFADVFLQTNGIIIDRHIKTMGEATRFTAMSISVCGHTEELMAATGVRQFKRIIQNISRMVCLKDKGLRTLLNVKVLVTRQNFQHVPEMVKFYEELGVEIIALRLVQDFNYGGEGARAISVELTPDERVIAHDIIAASSYGHPSLTHFVKVLNHKPTIPGSTRRCYNAIDGHFACITADGEVYLGNPEIGDPRFSIGNIVTHDWDDIWLSPRHLQVVAMMDERQCAGTCPLGMCRHVKAHQGVEAYLNGELALNEHEIMNNLGAFI